MIGPQDSMAGAIELVDQLIAAPSGEARLDVLERHKAASAHLPRQRPTMPTFDWGPRKALTELRPRHLHMVEEYGFRRDYDRDVLGEYFTAIGISYSEPFENPKRWKRRTIVCAKS